MKPIHVAIALLACGALTAGCAPLTLPASSGGAGDFRVTNGRDASPSTISADANIGATLLPTQGDPGESLVLRLDRAAYTAVFRVVPGQGAMMIYPRPGFGAPDGYLFPGIHRVVSAGPGMSFVGSLNGLLSSSMPLPGSMGPDAGPEYYFVVASGQPLRLESTLFGGSWHYPSGGGYPTLQSIISQTIPKQSAGAWTTDYFVHWPQTIAATSQQGFVSLTCNGSRLWVDPTRYERAVQALCGPEGLPPGPGVSPEEPMGPDPDGVVTPRRRQPVSDAQRLTSRQLEDPEAWEAARSDASGFGAGQQPRVLPPTGTPRDASGPTGPARREPGDELARPPAPDRAPSGASLDPAAGPIRLRPTLGSDLLPDYLSGGALPADRVWGEDPPGTRIRPRLLDPALSDAADAGRIRPGYQFPIDPVQPDDWISGGDPAAGIQGRVPGATMTPVRRRPFPVEPPQAIPAVPLPADDVSGGETQRTRPDL